MEELSRLMAAHGVEAWLRETNSLAALVDPEGRVIECNPAFSRLGVGGRLGTLADPESRAALEELRRAALQSGAIRRGAVSLLTAQGSTSYDASLIPLPGGLTIFLAEARLQNGEALGEDVARLMQENARMQQKLNAKQIEIDAVITQAHEVSHTDELTLIFNRRQIIADLQREVAYAERYDTPLSISMVDVDHFKRVNDSYGHAVGDAVLRSVAAFLRDNIRGPDIVGRYGGEEFLVLLPRARLESAMIQAGRLCSRLRAAPVETGELSLTITVSAGVAELRRGSEDWQKLLSRADAAMYEAKAQGRDRWVAAQ
jgi:diguanylate cyclase (GGDEF)-like protein